MQAARREVTFVVRIWLTEGAPCGDAWRGSVREVSSDQRRFVTTTRDIADFITTHLAQRQPGEA